MAEETDSAAASPVGLGAQYDPFVAHVDPYPFFARLRAEEPVSYSPRLDAWLVTRYDDIATVLRDPETFSSERALPNVPQRRDLVRAQQATSDQSLMMLFIDPPRHTRLRAVAGEAFSAARVAALEPMVRDVADRLIDRLDSPPIDLISRFAYPFPLTVILRVLGVPPEDLERCGGWTQDYLTLNFGKDATDDELAAAARGAAEFDAYAQDLVRQRAADPQDDLISRIMTTPVRGYEPYTAEEALGFLPTFIVAGHETTANLIGNLMWLLFAHPGQLSQVREDPGLIPAVVEETLRFDTPVPGLGRVTTREVDLSGTRIPAGARLLLLYGSANHDEGEFTDPEEFRVDRVMEAAHLGFGRGIHFCLGAPLARIEARIAVERLLGRLSGLRLADPDQRPTQIPRFPARGWQSLGMAWDVRHPAGAVPQVT